jgi:hypothetical protein
MAFTVEGFNQGGLMPIKPSTHEESYFAQLELERKRKGVFEKVASVQVLEREEQKILHWMFCPKCGSELTEIGYRDQRVDHCEACGGIWLDAGELEALATKEDGFLAGLRKVFQN